MINTNKKALQVVKRILAFLESYKKLFVFIALVFTISILIIFAPTPYWIMSDLLVSRVSNEKVNQTEEVSELKQKIDEYKTQNDELKKKYSEASVYLSATNRKILGNEVKSKITLLPIDVTGSGNKPEWFREFLNCENETIDGTEVRTEPKLSEIRIEKNNTLIKTTTYICSDSPRINDGFNNTEYRKVYKGGKLIAYITDPFKFSKAGLRISDDQNYIYGIDLDSKNKDDYVIVDLVKGRKITLKYSGCNTGDVSWDEKDRLFTYFFSDKTETFETCIWNRDGQLEYRIDSKLYYIFGAPGGVMRQSSINFINGTSYFYQISGNGDDLDFNQRCILQIQNTLDQNDVINYEINDIKLNEFGYFNCASLSFDFEVKEGKITSISYSQDLGFLFVSSN